MKILFILLFICNLAYSQVKLPARMQAESYTSMKFISPANDTAGTGSGGTMATFNPGSSASYYINVVSTATFIINIRVADGNGGGVLQIRNSSSFVMKSFTTPATGSLNSMKTISDTFKLSAGKYIIRMYDLSGKYNVDWLEIVNVPSPIVPVTPVILTKGYVDSNYVSKVYLDSVIRAIVKTWFFDATYFKGNPLDSLNPFSLQIGEDTGGVAIDTATGFVPSEHGDPLVPLGGKLLYIPQGTKTTTPTLSYIKEPAKK